MKKLTTISLFIFWAVVTSILTAGLVFYQNNQKNNLVNNNSNNNVQATGQSNQTKLDMAEIAKHNSAQSCWLLISGKVYDVTSYLNLHPAGSGTILPTCGTDATQAYATKDQNPGRNHSNRAQDQLTQYFIGNFNQAASQTKNSSQSNTQSADQAAKPVQTTNNQTVNTSKVVLSSAEVAKHNKASDCWMTISGNVYNVTASISYHPGGAGTIINYCGQDATSAFATKGGRGNNHSSSAYGQLGSFLIGKLNQTVTGQTIQNTATNAANAAAKVPAGGEDEYDD